MRIPFSAQFVLDGLSAALGCKAKHITRKTKILRRSNGIYELERWNGVVRLSRKADFTKQEKTFVKVIINSYDKLIVQLSTRGVTHQYLQTAITSSVFDIGISRFIAKHSRKYFLNIHGLIQYFKLLSYERYEGEQVRVGCFIKSPGEIEGDEFDVNQTKFEICPASKKVRINQDLIEDSAFLRYVNGTSSFYLCDTNLDVFGFVNILSSDYDSFRAISGASIEDYMKHDEDIHFYIGVTSSGDIELFVDDTYRLLFRKGRWYFIDCGLIDSIISDECDEINPWRIFYSMSKIKKGTVALIASNESDVEDLVVRHISDDQGMRQAIEEAIADVPVERLCTTGALIRILTTDGMTIFNKQFNTIVDFNSIVDTGVAGTAEGGGGRTSAAIAGSTCGVGVKVSEDGPISIYKNQKLVYSVG